VKPLRLLLDYWYVPLLVIGAVWIWVITRGRKTPADTLGLELDAIRAGSEAREAKARLGHEKALAEVKARHAADLAKLEAEQAAKAKELENDPVALARFAVRAARSSR